LLYIYLKKYIFEKYFLIVSTKYSLIIAYAFFTQKFLHFKYQFKFTWMQSVIEEPEKIYWQRIDNIFFYINILQLTYAF